MLDEMDKGTTFSIAFVTYNAQKKTGGEYIELPQCIKHNFKTKEQRKRQVSQPTPIYSTANKPKNPNHYNNCTRNIVQLPQGNLIKIHIRLVRRFNNLIVL